MFSDEEVKSLGPTLAKIIYVGLQQFREHNWRLDDDDAEIEAFDTMCEAIKFVADDVDIDNLATLDRQAYKKGMKYFAKNFHNLWH